METIKSIEEKAKAYDEAIKRVENIKTGKCETTFMFTEGLFEHIFPSLTESEDERIGLLNYLYDVHDDDEERARWIAWLEKQGEQKQPKELTNSEFVEKCKGLSRLEQHILALVPTRPIDAIKVDARTIRYLVEQEQGEKKPNPCGNCGIATNNCQNFPCAIRDGEQNPVEWSEEDESMLQNILECLKNGWRKLPTDILKYESWLKSLRPQPKEWSKDDEILLEGIIGAVSNQKLLNKYQMEWLSNLRPQKQWKPSDEQMQALSNAGNSFRPFEECHKVLWSLYNDLKKLREE